MNLIQSSYVSWVLVPAKSMQHFTEVEGVQLVEKQVIEEDWACTNC